MTTQHTIKIGGEVRPVHFGFFAFSIFEKETGLSFMKMGEIAQDMKVDNLVSFLYAGLMGGYNKTKKTPDFEKSDIYDWLDEEDTDLEEIFESFAKSMPTKLGEGKRLKKKNSRQ